MWKKEIKVNGNGGEKGTGFPAIVLYYFHIPGDKNVSRVMHRLAFSKPFVRCMATVSDLHNLRHGECQALREMKQEKSEFGTFMEAFGENLKSNHSSK